MAVLSYNEFINKYYGGGGTHAIDWLQGAYSKYVGRESSGVSEGAATTTPTYTGLTPEQIAYAEEHHPGVSIGATPGYNPAAPGTWEDYIKLLEAGGYSTAGLTEPGVTPPALTPTVEEQIASMPPAPTPVAPGLAPAPTVTPAPTVGAPEVPAIPGVTPAPTIPATEVAPAPEYVPTEEERAFAEMYGGTIQDIITARGEGIPEEVINLMIRQQTQALGAREDENLRVMHNNMEKRGITQSGLVFWNEQQIKSATTTALANSITDIQIKSSLMKMASFENALGHAGQFLGYLQEQSKMAYAGKMATWEAQTQADLVQYQAQIGTDLEQWKMVNQYNLADWQANTQALFAQWDRNSATMVESWKLENQFSIAEWETKANHDMAVFKIETEALFAKWSAETDIYKLSIAQAYEQDNMDLLAQINAQSQEDEQLHELELLEIKLEAEEQAAAQEGFFSLLGTLFGFLFGGF